MIQTDNDHIMMIEPTSTVASTPLVDSLTRRMAAALRSGHTSGHGYRGVHSSTGVYGGHPVPCSDNVDHYIVGVDGIKRTTNSLATHYLAYFRGDVPAAEIDKLGFALPIAEVEPTQDELWPGSARARMRKEPVYR